jgi:hypothetical protein
LVGLRELYQRDDDDFAIGSLEVDCAVLKIHHVRFDGKLPRSISPSPGWGVSRYENNSQYERQQGLPAHESEPPYAVKAAGATPNGNA